MSKRWHERSSPQGNWQPSARALRRGAETLCGVTQWVRLTTARSRSLITAMACPATQRAAVWGCESRCRLARAAKIPDQGCDRATTRWRCGWSIASGLMGARPPHPAGNSLSAVRCRDGNASARVFFLGNALDSARSVSRPSDRLSTCRSGPAPPHRDECAVRPRGWLRSLMLAPQPTDERKMA